MNRVSTRRWQDQDDQKPDYRVSFFWTQLTARTYHQRGESIDQDYK